MARGGWVGHAGVVERVVELPGGRTLTARRVTEADHDGLAELYERLSPADRRRRFFSGSRPPREFLDRWIRRTTENGYGMVAVVNEDGTDTVIADAGYVVQPDGSGELAITVDPAWRGWLGHWVLDALVEAAAEHGVPSLEADVLLENRDMLALLDARGFATMEHADWNTVRMVIGTGGRVPPWPGHHERPRILVEVPGARWHAEQELTDAGYQVLSCPGPHHGPGGHCPLLEGGRCELADGADAIVVSLVMDESGREILHQHRVQNPEVPVCVSSVRAHDLEVGASDADAVVPLTRDVAPLVAALDRLTGGPPLRQGPEEHPVP